jgi:hypothetical protein
MAQICELGSTNLPRKCFQFYKTYLEACKEQHSYLFWDLTQSIKDLVRFRTKIFPGETCEVFAPVQGNEPVKVITTLSPSP